MYPEEVGNRDLANVPVGVFKCPSESATLATLTNYAFNFGTGRVVEGADGIIVYPPHSLRLADVTDGLSQTVCFCKETEIKEEPPPLKVLVKLAIDDVEVTDDVTPQLAIYTKMSLRGSVVPAANIAHRAMVATLLPKGEKNEAGSIVLQSSEERDAYWFSGTMKMPEEPGTYELRLHSPKGNIVYAKAITVK